MPIYSRETLKTHRLPWVLVEDFDFIVLGRHEDSAAVPRASAGDHEEFWGHDQAAPLPTSKQFVPGHDRERLVVISGEVAAQSDQGRVTMRKRDWIDVPSGGVTVTNQAGTHAEIAWIAGTWDESVRTEICLFKPGHPCDYHFHDGDEYWFVFRGHFTLTYNGADYAMRPGLMLAAGMGYEHGVPVPEELFQAVVFATGLEGAQRDGHLTRELHGDPQSARDVPLEALAAHRLGGGR